MLNELETAYKYCENITKFHAKSFYFAAKFLPKHKQKAVYPIYAFCRHVDDEVDKAEMQSENEAVKAVETWKYELESIYFNTKQQNHADSAKEELQIANHKLQPKDRRLKTKDQNMVFLAWQDLLKTYKIPQNLPVELMQGVLMDTRIKRYKTFDELYVYCYRVASTVGLMSSEILGYSDETALDYAEAMGIGMQLTNILRDVKEDAAIGRIYLPQEDLRKFDVSESQILAGEMSENFVELMKFQIERARDFYRQGELGIALLEKDSRFTVLIASRIYGKILDAIEAQNYDIFKKRAGTSKTQKLIALPRIWREARTL